MAAEELRFGEFRVDGRNEQLWRGQEALSRQTLRIQLESSPKVN
jgi:hypothetical protein